MGQGKTLYVTSMGVLEQTLYGKKLFATYHLFPVITCRRCDGWHQVQAVQIEGANGTPAEAKQVYNCGDESYYVLATDEVLTPEYTYLNLESFYETFKSADQGATILSGCVFLVDEAYLFFDSRTSSSKSNRLFNSFIFQTRKRGVDLYLTTHDVTRVDRRVRAAIDLRVSCRFNPGTGILRARVRDMHTGERRTQRIFGPRYWAFYDTNEMVRPPGKLYNMTSRELS